MSDPFFKFTEEQMKTLINIAITYQQIHQEQMAQLIKKLYQVSYNLHNSLANLTIKILELGKQYRTAIQEGITNFEKPVDYDPSKVIIHTWTRGFSISTGIDMLEDIKLGHFDYLYVRFNEGIEAYMEKDFQKAIFTFLSCLDGILKEFCEQHKTIDCQYRGRFPLHQETFDHLMLHYEMQFAADNAQFQDRLQAFFEHRHQIMHGDRYAYFDENIATISLLFLGLVFYTVKDDI